MRHHLSATASLVVVVAIVVAASESLLGRPNDKGKQKTDVQSDAAPPKAAPRPSTLPDAATRPFNCRMCWSDCQLNPSTAPAAAGTSPGAGPGPRWRQREGAALRGGGPPWMRSSSGPVFNPKAEEPSPMEVFHRLLEQHAKIRRTVQEIPGGVFSQTTSDDSSVARDIKTHVWQMKARIENKQPLRRWDPLFDELFRQADKIVMKVEEIEGGARVTETSDDPQVAKLIRQHAIRGVSEFVRDGFNRAHRASPLPEGYRAPATGSVAPTGQ